MLTVEPFTRDFVGNRVVGDVSLTGRWCRRTIGLVLRVAVPFEYLIDVGQICPQEIENQ